jgi:uncharacterized small protein (DUF1192 family)
LPIRRAGRLIPPLIFAAKEGLKRAMAQEDAEPVRRTRGWAIAEISKEDLELFGFSELEERIEMLQCEIARVRAQLERKHAGRAAADAVFFKPS